MNRCSSSRSILFVIATLLLALNISATQKAKGDSSPSAAKTDYEVILKQLHFREIGPASMGGRIDDFAVVESNPDIIYVGAASGGVFKTTNGGTTWISNNVPTNIWHAVACSADGSRLVAAAVGRIWVSYTVPSPSLAFTASSDGKLVLSWTMPSTNFILQQTANPRLTNWEASGYYPVLNETNLQEEVKFPGPPVYPVNFFRLKQEFLP